MTETQNTSATNPFDRRGLASLSDLDSDLWREVVHNLEEQQESFLLAEGSFRSPGYRWPRDPLHEWSRVWEYPYAYHHLRDSRADTGERCTRRASGPG